MLLTCCKIKLFQIQWECFRLTMWYVVSTASRAGQELMEFMKRNDVKPFRNFLVPLAQVSIGCQASFQSMGVISNFNPLTLCQIIFAVKSHSMKISLPI